MAGTLRLLHRPIIAFTVTTSVSLDGIATRAAVSGGHRATTFLWHIITITGTWDIAIYINIAGTDVKIAELLGQTAAGVFRIPLDAAFASTRMAIPSPSKITYTEAVAGTLTDWNVFAVFGD